MMYTCKVQLSVVAQTNFIFENNGIHGTPAGPCSVAPENAWLPYAAPQSTAVSGHASAKVILLRKQKHTVWRPEQ